MTPLFIGAYVRLKSTNKIFRIVTFPDSTHIIITNRHSVNKVAIDEVEPVKLTPEIMLNIGFELNEHFDENFDEEDITVDLSFDKYEIERDNFLCIGFGGIVKYLHELQFLINLCGEELSIDEYVLENLS